MLVINFHSKNESLKTKRSQRLEKRSRKSGFRTFRKVNNWEVMGLLFGARGVTPKFIVNVLEKKFKIRKKKKNKLIIKDSLQILYHPIQLIQWLQMEKISMNE